MARTAKLFALVTIFALTAFGLHAQNASGAFQSDYGTITFQHVGNKVTGTYEHADGRIEGTIIGNTLSGWWYQNNGKGRFVFVFNRDFSAFSGTWSYENAEPSEAWNGKRIGAAAMPPAAPIYSIAGIYDTSYGEMVLQQNGTSIKGTYTDGGGTIEATLSGNTLRGYWIQSNGRGRITFVFDATFSSFKGAWSYNDEEPSAGWDGKRRGAPQISQNPPPPQAPPQPAPPPAPSPPPTTTTSQAEATELFNNWNKAMVYNGPSGATYFYLSRLTTITRIITYHWNNGRGQTPGQISLMGQDGKGYGPWKATGTSGSGAQNVNWVVNPNISLPAGLYLVNDSDPGTWSHNTGSFGCGFTNVSGR
jgi:hypothetical protein